MGSPNRDLGIFIGELDKSHLYKTIHLFHALPRHTCRANKIFYLDSEKWFPYAFHLDEYDAGLLLHVSFE